MGVQENYYAGNVIVFQVPEEWTYTGVGEERSQLQNKKNAFNRLIETPRFRLWHNNKCMEAIQKKTSGEKLAEMMEPKNIKVETRVNGVWQNTERGV